MADALGMKAKNNSIHNMPGNILSILTSGSAAPLGMAETLGMKARNMSIQSIPGNALRNIGINNQTNERKDQILEIKHKI
jgi:hypothetical protein